MGQIPNPNGRRTKPQVTLADRVTDPELMRMVLAKDLGRRIDKTYSRLMRRAMDEFDREFGP